MAIDPKRTTEYTPHICRACGQWLGTHSAFAGHWIFDHGFRRPTNCHMQCSFKATYHERQSGQQLYGKKAP